MTAASRSGFFATALAVLALGAAFGYVEATVVVYLRAALGLAPGAVMANDAAGFGTFEMVEMTRGSSMAPHAGHRSARSDRRRALSTGGRRHG